LVDDDAIEIDIDTKAVLRRLRALRPELARPGSTITF